MDWREAIICVLRRAGRDRAMHYAREITQQILDEKLVDHNSADPRQTVSNVLNTSVNNEGANSPFVKVMQAYYKLREDLYDEQVQDGRDNGGNIIDDAAGGDEEGDDPAGGIITSIGMYWNRADVKWRSNPRLLGCQHHAAARIDFCEQRGVYLLYNHNQVIYVGRTSERALGRRLYEHTRDRLNARWNQFSWFGLCPIIENNNDAAYLGDIPGQYASAFMIPVLEALLIEACEPGQNRRRGDDFGAVEYIQVVKKK